jgi:hypothetical protein
MLNTSITPGCTGVMAAADSHDALSEEGLVVKVRDRYRMLGACAIPRGKNYFCSSCESEALSMLFMTVDVGVRWQISRR